MARKKNDVEEVDVPLHRVLALPLPWQYDSWSRLQQAKQQQRLPHALLITGVPGIGKLRLAEALSQSLLCSAPDAMTGYACGECRHCVLYQANSHPDMNRIGLEEKSRQIKIDQIRDWVGSQSKTAHLGEWKISIVEPAEQMNIAAANAFLKFLEEPTPGTLLILVSSMPGSILPTVRSRCQQLTLAMPAKGDASHWLQQQLMIDQAQAEQLLEEGGGPVDIAESWLNDTLGVNVTREKELNQALTGQLSLFALAEQWQMYPLDQNLRWLEVRLAKVLRGVALSDAVVSKQKVVHRGFALWRQLLQWRQQVQSGANPNLPLFLEHLLGQYLDILRQFR